MEVTTGDSSTGRFAARLTRSMMLAVARSK
jgi:hypothetical protein